LIFTVPHDPDLADIYVQLWHHWKDDQPEKANAVINLHYIGNELVLTPERERQKVHLKQQT